MKRVKLRSDYTPPERPNSLTIIRDEQGDVHINMHVSKENKDNGERGVRIAVSGTKHSYKVRQAWYALIDALEEEGYGLEH